MTIKTIDLDTIHLTLEELLETLDSDTEILLMRGTLPVARIAPAQAEPTAVKRILGLHEGAGWMSDDFMDELPDSFWLGEDE